MEHHETTDTALRFGIYGAASTIVGIVVSGPIDLLLVSAVHPQPAWLGARSFVEHYHPIQTLPFFGGFLLVLGYLVMIAALHHIAREKERTATLIAVILVTVFAVLIFYNYINQTTFIPALVRDYRPEYESAITMFSLSNPNSLCWAIEMWGYAFLGMATWFAARVFDRRGVEKATAMLMVSNGITSLAGGVIAAIDLEWVFTPAGLISYAGWNLLVLALSIGVVLSLRRRASRTTSLPHPPTLSPAPGPTAPRAAAARVPTRSPASP